MHAKAGICLKNGMTNSNKDVVFLYMSDVVCLLCRLYVFWGKGDDDDEEL
jgi:hypothetical protein